MSDEKSVFPDGPVVVDLLRNRTVDELRTKVDENLDWWLGRLRDSGVSRELTKTLVDAYNAGLSDGYQQGLVDSAAGRAEAPKWLDRRVND